MHQEDDRFIPMHKVTNKLTDTDDYLMYGTTTSGITISIGYKDFFKQCQHIANDLSDKGFNVKTIDVAIRYTNTDLLFVSGFSGIRRCDN
jgi:hypothetical protein